MFAFRYSFFISFKEICEKIIYNKPGNEHVTYDQLHT